MLGDWKLRAPQRSLSDSQSNCSPPVHTTTVGPEDPLCCLLLTPVSAVSHTCVSCLFLTPVSAVCFSHPCQLCFSQQCQLSVSHTSVSLSHLSAVSHTGVSCVLLTPASAVSHTSVSCLFLRPVSAVCFSHQCQLSVSHSCAAVSQSGVSCLFLTPMLAASDGSYRLSQSMNIQKRLGIARRGREGEGGG